MSGQGTIGDLFGPHRIPAVVRHLHCDAAAIVLHIIRGSAADRVSDLITGRRYQRQRIVVNGPFNDLAAVLCFAGFRAVALGSRLVNDLSGIL